MKRNRNSYDDYLEEKYWGRRVKILYNDKPLYKKEGLVTGLCGVVSQISNNKIGVLVDGKNNDRSTYGVYWFKKNELEILEEEIKMKEFKNVAIVNLLEDCNTKEYAFALYEKDMELINGRDTMVVVNARGKDRRVLGVVKGVLSLEEYNKKYGKRDITAQVIGVVNMDRYIEEVEEEKRLKEIAKKKAAIEKELKAEIAKRVSMEYYKMMATQYSDNPRLMELVNELDGLSETA